MTKLKISRTQRGKMVLRVTQCERRCGISDGIKGMGMFMDRERDIIGKCKAKSNP
jgi:hypothetical protein